MGNLVLLPTTLVTQTAIGGLRFGFSIRMARKLANSEGTKEMLKYPKFPNNFLYLGESLVIRKLIFE